MTTTTTTATRPRDPICPSWCDGHDDKGWQSWERRTADGQLVRDHASPAVSTDCNSGPFTNPVAIDVCRSEELGTGRLSPAVVDLYVGNDAVSLTPTEAREHAARLVEAAESAEREMGANA